MTEASWLACTHPDELRTLDPRVFSARRERLFGCACVRYVWTLTGDELPEAVRTAEQFADGATTKAALRRARRAVRAERHALEAAEAAARPAWAAYWLTEVLATENAFGQVLNELYDASGDLIFDESEWAALSHLVRDVFGNPFRPVAFDPAWRTDTAVSLARAMYEARDFGAMPILADALQDAGCDSDILLTHCRSDGTHVRGCWVVDLVLGKE